MAKRNHQLKFRSKSPVGQILTATGFTPIFKQDIVDNSKYPGPMVKLLTMKRGISRKRHVTKPA